MSEIGTGDIRRRYIRPSFRRSGNKVSLCHHPLPGSILQHPAFLILPLDIGIPLAVFMDDPFVFQLCRPEHALSACLHVSDVGQDRLMDLNVSETPLVLQPIKGQYRNGYGDDPGRTSSPLTRKALILRSNSIFLEASCMI